MMIHSGEKSYQCSQCDKAFNETSALMKHMRNHIGEKPYQYSQCDKAFSRTDHFKKHTMTHTGETPGQCIKCDKDVFQNLDTQISYDDSFW